MGTSKPGATPNRFGTFGGVFTPSTLTILGVIMFLRFEPAEEGGEDLFMETFSKRMGNLPNVMLVSSAGNASLTA